MNIVEPVLPPRFADLTGLVADWALPTERERYAKREASSFEEIQAFYDTMLERAEEATAYLDTHPLDAFKPEDKRLMQLLLSLVTVGFAVEVWKQPKTPDTGSAKLLSLGEPYPI